MQWEYGGLDEWFTFSLYLNCLLLLFLLLFRLLNSSCTKGVFGEIKADNKDKSIFGYV